MSDLESRTVRRRNWLAWAGTTDELRSIGRIVERLFDSITVPEGGGSPADSVFGVDKLTFETTVTHGDDAVWGGLDRALSELDRRTVTSVSFRITTRIGEDRLRVELSWRDLYYPVRLVISSPDPGWAKQAFTSISEEIDKGRPRWAWVCSGWGRSIVTTSSTITFATGVSLLVAPFVHSPTFRLSIVIGIELVMLVLVGVSQRTYRWIFPAVELIVPGGTSTGSRRFAFIGSLALTVAVGILVNFIS